MPPIKQQLGRAIRRLRAPLSQEAFAARVGLHRTYVGAVERGEKNISIDNIERIAKALGLRVSELFAEAESQGGHR